MLPALAKNDLANGGLADAIALGQSNAVPAVVEISYITHHLLGQSGGVTCRSARAILAVTLDRIRDILRLGSFDDVPRIETSCVVTGMATIGFRPTTVSKEEREAMRPDDLLSAGK